MIYLFNISLILFIIFYSFFNIIHNITFKLVDWDYKETIFSRHAFPSEKKDLYVLHDLFSHKAEIIFKGNDKKNIEIRPTAYNVVLEDDTYNGEMKIEFKFIANVRLMICYCVWKLII